MLEPRLQHKLHRHHHQGHTGLPGGPLSGLVLRHPDMPLGMLEVTLDPEELRLHLRQISDTGPHSVVAQGVFESSGGGTFPANDQMPTLGSRTVLVPQPHSALQHLDHQVSLGRVAQGRLPPGTSQLHLDPFARLHRPRVTVVTHARTTPAPILRWQIQLRVAQGAVPIRMNLGQECFSLLRQGSQKFQRLAVQAVDDSFRVRSP
jgi:hypothetical protein